MSAIFTAAVGALAIALIAGRLATAVAGISALSGFAERRPRLDPLEVRAAEWCERAARQLRSGQSLGSAVGAATTADRRATPSALQTVADHATRGASLRQALVDRETERSSAVELVLTALTTCATVGGPAAPTLERVAATLRTRAALHDEIAAQSAQARLSAIVLTLVPVALLVLLVVFDGDVREQLTRPAGIATIAAGATCNLAGWTWMRHLTRRPT